MKNDHEFGMIIHDIRQPLASIELFLRVFQNSPSEKQAELLKNCDLLIRQINKANILLDNLIGTRNEIFNGENCYFEHLVGAVLKDMSQLFIGKEIEFKYSFDSKRQMLIDRNKIERVVFNLLANAIEAMPNTGTISFSTQDIQIGNVDFTEVRIRNTGSYIEPEYLDSIFNPFFTRNKESGTGLGLAICRKAISFHGGQISCRSDQKEGTEFIFSLPSPKPGTSLQFNLPKHSKNLEFSDIFKDLSTTDLKTMDQIAATLAAHSNYSASIAIVEDDSNYRSCLVERIHQYGRGKVEVFQGQTFFEGFHSVLKNNPKVLLVDLDLSDPIFTGIDLIRALRDHKYPGLICLHSNHVTSSLFLKCFEAGADLCVPKPLSAQNFLHILTFLYSREGNSRPAGLTDLNFIENDVWNFSIEKTLDLVPYPVFSKDVEGRYQVCNQSFSTQILGLPKSQIYNRGFSELVDRIPEELANIYWQKDKDLLDSGGVQTYESEVMCSDGKKRKFTFFKKALFSSAGKCVGLTGIMYPA